MNTVKFLLTKCVISGISTGLHQPARIAVAGQFVRFSSTLAPKVSSLKIPTIRAGSILGSKSIGNISTLQMKKRPVRKKRPEEAEVSEDGHFTVTAYATAEEYDLEKLLSGLVQQELYEPKKFICTDDNGVEPDVLYVSAKYQVDKEPRDIFFFREGTVILWNIGELECSNVLSFLKQYEQDSYDENVVTGESEQMVYNYVSTEQASAHLKRGLFLLTRDEDSYLEKYTFSNAMSLSVKLGIWEASLDKYIESIAFVTDNLKRGTKIKISRADMLRKTGELFALRHLINLSSDLLDTPDFYWDREHLENLYAQTCGYFSISRRTKVMNEKLNHCVELADLITSNLNDAHHIRLEWMIIILIMVEVVFEFIHYFERYMAAQETEALPAVSAIEVIQSVE
ncbi:required for meiotic nuclear division protein 1 homolog [Phlebotomus papatasi]|uniref:required for meiotic nuclear division protein 1 homolog n=1 Tax=Phlebotomus papatasi TaxID=29031 RepID=UPI0024837A8A|nr:required for meiotic nuclear division protein 1 homolog [Phlebotomus papatasi]